ncbi:MAG: flagellar biosynthetic protein FliO [Terracidiphilus sp.]
MTVRNRATNPTSLAARRQLASVTPRATGPEPTFRQLLQKRGSGPIGHSSTRWHIASSKSQSALQPRSAALSFVTRAWSWLHTKYTISANKRLRLAETVSLGDKRFVSLVTVDGREFLIGGGASGVSLLAEWGTKAKPATTYRRKSAAKEKTA